MRTKELRKSIQRHIIELAKRECVPVDVVRHELELIQQTVSVCLARYELLADSPPEPGNCDRCGRVLGELDGSVCDACRDGKEVAA
jgi:hypothetical protein